MAVQEHSEGWITFAAILAGVAGVANVIYGLGSVLRAGPLAQYSVLLTSITTWGWLSILFGALQIIAAFMLAARSSAGRILAIVLASISLILWMLLLGALPLAGLTALVLDVLVIYGLSVTPEYFAREAYERRPGAAPSGGMPAGSH